MPQVSISSTCLGAPSILTSFVRKGGMTNDNAEVSL
jgi:hypothetical protein